LSSKVVLPNSIKSSYTLIVVLIVEIGGLELMARQLNRLTALQVTKLSKPGLYGDGGGLTLQITSTGVKSWLFRFMREGKAHGMGLGATHTISLVEARQKALDARKLLADGFNPMAVKKQKLLAAALERAKMMTFDQCATSYIEAHKASWKNAKHIDQWTNTLATYASPVFGQQPAGKVIWRTCSPASASRPEQKTTRPFPGSA
jgi:hypothetical protein